MRLASVLLPSVALLALACSSQDTAVPAAGDPGSGVVATDRPLKKPGDPVSVLEAQLESPDAATRAAAAWSLAGLQDAEQRTIAKLESLLDDPEQQVRYAVAWALGHLSDADNYFDAPAKPVRMPQPHYPKEAFRNRTEGTVLIEILVGEHGEIAHRETRRSVATLDAAALASIDQWTFLPATAGERPVASLARAPVTFRIY